MADINATIGDAGPNNIYTWLNVTESDTAQPVLVDPGFYHVSVEGTFGGATVAIHGGKTTSTMSAIDSTNLSFTANGQYGLETGRTYIKPSISGGTSQDVTIYLTPIRA